MMAQVHTQSLDEDEDSDLNLDLVPCWIQQHDVLILCILVTPKCILLQIVKTNECGISSGSTLFAKTKKILRVCKTISFVCLFCCFTSQFNSYGHGWTVSSPNHTLSWASLKKYLTSTSCTNFRL